VISQFFAADERGLTRIEKQRRNQGLARMSTDFFLSFFAERRVDLVRFLRRGLMRIDADSKATAATTDWRG
jgi:hypothetical protein